MNKVTSLRPARRQQPVAYYVGLLTHSNGGEWRVLFPDVADCEAHGFTMQDATYAATTALARCASRKELSFPQPRNLVQIERDHEWFAKNGITLAGSVVTMVPLWPTQHFSGTSIDDEPPIVD